MSAINRDAAVSFLHLLSSGKVKEAYDRYIAPDFRHHNPYFRGEAGALCAAMEQHNAEFPHNRFRDGLIVEEWDVGQQVPKESPNRHGMF